MYVCTMKPINNNNNNNADPTTGFEDKKDFDIAVASSSTN